MVPKPDPSWIVFFWYFKKWCSIRSFGEKKQTPCFSTTRMWDPPSPEFVACDTKDKEGVPIHSCQAGGVGWNRKRLEGSTPATIDERSFSENIKEGSVDVGGNRMWLHLNDCHNFPWDFFWKIQIIQYTKSFLQPEPKTLPKKSRLQQQGSAWCLGVSLLVSITALPEMPIPQVQNPSPLPCSCEMSECQVLENLVEAPRAQKNTENWEIKNQSVEGCCRYSKHHPNLESCNKKIYFFFANLCFFVRDPRRFFFLKENITVESREPNSQLGHVISHHFFASFFCVRKERGLKTKSHVPLRKAMVPWSLFLSVPMCVAYASSLGASNAGNMSETSIDGG